MKLNNVLEVAKSYARSAFVACLTLYVANPTTSLADFAKAALVAVAAPILRALDVNDSAFGLGAKKK